MLVSKWGNSLAVRLPRAVVDNLELKSGDRLEIVSATPERVVLAKDRRRVHAVERMRARALPLPTGYVFDRDDANVR
ncbi:MAG: AbrB/MazE/SpoVT family DNA-binding domain-containing protein [Defluviicoccus sp.]|nr:AbrB/MazE/SpoVT family DNA-binding domain-containing protein [Defluviicoccus sp.]